MSTLPSGTRLTPIHSPLGPPDRVTARVGNVGHVTAPTQDVERVAASHRRLLGTMEGLTDESARGPSLLPGWTVGHLLTHLARNADSHVHRARAARRGEMVDQYPGGRPAREAAIEAGAGRPAAELAADVRRSASAAEEAWAEVPDHAWGALSRDVRGQEVPLRNLPASRWREAEVHLVDLGLGLTPLGWSGDFVDAWLPGARARAAGGGEAGAAQGARALFDHPAEELAWRYGRLQRPGLPPPPPWE